MLAVHSHILVSDCRKPTDVAPSFTNAQAVNRRLSSKADVCGRRPMFPKSKSVMRKCSLCEEHVLICYECMGCRFSVCLICAVKNHWKCPQCNGDLA